MVEGSAEPVGETDRHGIIVGWTAQDLGSRMMLCIQSSRRSPRSGAEVEQFRYFLTKDQAALMANFLYRVSGHTPPRARSSWLARWFGR